MLGEATGAVGLAETGIPGLEPAAMGRTYFVEEAVGQYLSDLSVKFKPYVTGLLIGQCSPQRDYIIRAARTPPKEEQKEGNTSPSKLDSIDEEWFTAHASQISRMLPGGLLVLGVFIIATPELSKDSQNALRRNGLNRWSKQIEDSIFLINGQVKDNDTELLEWQ
ncbi:hypothetical protein CIB84_005037, partial [Bambusicola thoracicus]